jgi:hypothetical protein
MGLTQDTTSLLQGLLRGRDRLKTSQTRLLEAGHSSPALSYIWETTFNFHTHSFILQGNPREDFERTPSFRPN